MGTFLRTNITPEGFIKGAARLLVAPANLTFPEEIDDVIDLASGGTQFDAASGWTDLGATKTGINIARNNAEETYDVDQIQTDILTLPTGWEMSVGTALAEVTAERLAYAWEATIGPTNTSTAEGVDEKSLYLGAPEAYQERRLAVVYRRPAVLGGTSQLIRAFVFRRVTRTPQDSSITFQRAGEQQTIPVRFRCLADTNAPSIDEYFGVMFDQVE